MSALLTDTRTRLSELASPDEFEALATAVLREAEPAYASLIHVGTNTVGRTVRSPVDGVGIRTHRGTRRLLLVQHTITARKGLRRKWLDPKDGDLSKAKEIFAAETRRKAVREATVVLTTTVDPDEGLVRDVHAAAGEGLKVDLWPGSRIADFLDRDPEGQWLRQQQFGTVAGRLSASQAREISGQSLDDYLTLVARDDIVPRSLDTALIEFASGARGAGFVIGESGLGKSTSLRNLGDGWLAEGGIALVLDHEMVERAATVEQAVALGLRKWAPSLHADCGQVALSLATPGRPLLLIVEDVNRSTNPRRIVERLLGWSSKGQGEPTSAQWRLLCPVWRGNSGISDRQMGEHVQARSCFVDRFDRTEAVEALQTRATRAGIDLTTLQLDELAAALGDDPLLVGLNADWSNANPKDVILSYVADNLERAADGALLTGDLRNALEALAERMVETRSLFPSWGDIKTWFALDPDGLAAARQLINQGRVVRLGTDDRLAYRHDRVRDHLLAKAVERLIETDRFRPDLWEDPFYAEPIGTALCTLPIDVINAAEVRNPVALFAALQNPTLDEGRRDRLVAAATRWVNSPGFLEEAAKYRRHHAMHYLARTDGPHVASLATEFPNSVWKLEALARNGSARAAAAVCRSHEPGIGSGWRDRMISHALSRQPEFIDELAALLWNDDVPANEFEGMLNLAGEIGDPVLCDALAERWSRSDGAAALSTGWLWAVLRCGPPSGHPHLEEICRAWARLPTKTKNAPDDRDRNPRWDIAGYTLPSAFARKPDPAAISFLIDLPKRHRGLSHVVGSILSRVDTPEAVLFSVRRSAAIDRRIDGTDGINLFSNDLERLWSPEQYGRTLSVASRSALAKVWKNRRLSKFERRTAFSVWCQTPTKEEITRLPELEADPILADRALKTRLAHRDHSAVPLLVDRIRTAERAWPWWYAAQRIGLGGLHAEVRAFFNERRLRPPVSEDGWPDHIMAQLLMDDRDDFAISMIHSNWDQLRTAPMYVQAALYIATPELVALGQAAIRESGDVERMLRFVGMHWGIRNPDRVGITELAQLKALEPFYAAMREAEHGEMHIEEFFEAANRLQELEWRKKHLDSYIRRDRSAYCPADKEAVLASLCYEVEVQLRNDRSHFRIDHWFEWREKELWQRSALVELIGAWARDRADEPAVELLCEALMHFGERRDLGLLERLTPALSRACSDAIANCVYEVRRRSLNG